ncbi:hypothetical protein A3K79_05800 [Candidatus Bathyarchaeota archaeon RBG_13_46_16b]|nr:MAG: hypothetical protein A3K79_05800 [Candidatus Bathyarchaeota archaeon RBG_13_46_16b]
MNVDLTLLSSEVKGFFERKRYVVEYGRDGDRISMIVRVQRSSETVRITIERVSDDLVVEGFFVDEKPPASFIPSLFGGGAFLLHKLRWRESLQKLEKEFGLFVEVAVKRLAGSSHI